MIKSTRIKTFLTNTIFRGISIINNLIPKNDNIVLLYSNMGFRDNIAYLYEYMISEGYNRKYKIYRSQNDTYRGELPSNVFVISNLKGVFCYLRARHIFYAFGKLPIYPSNSQKVVQMWHGSPFKGTDVHQKAEKHHDKSYYTDVISAASVFSEHWAKVFNCKIEQVSVCGNPRIDVMINPYRKSEIGIKEDEKIVMWMPTFRKSKKLGYSDVRNSNTLVPVIKNEDFALLNETLRKKRIRLMIKLHPMQDVDGVVCSELTNIILLTHEKFVESKLDLYRLLGTADALITDYSSVFYDYMLVNRPIAFTEDDFDDYKDLRGFSVENPDYYRAGHKIKSVDELISFLEDVANENDSWKEIRQNVNNEVNECRDFANSKRVLEIGKVYL